MRAALIVTLMLVFAAPGPALSQNAAAGREVFAQCRACHQVGPTARNMVGPRLNGLFGRRAASIEGFNYSTAFRALDKVWDERNLAEFLKDPQGVTPGTRMAFRMRGADADARIADLIAYLRQFGPDGQPPPN